MLPRTNANNKQGEYYLPDVIALMAVDGLPVHALTVDDPMELFGVNTPDDLQRLEKILQAGQVSWTS